MPFPKRAPRSMSSVSLAILRPCLRIECQFSGGEPWNAKVDPFSSLSCWKRASRSGAADTNTYCHSVSKTLRRSWGRSGRSKQRADCEIHWTIGRTSGLRCCIKSMQVVQAAALEPACSLTASTSFMTACKISMRSSFRAERAGWLSPSRKSVGNGSEKMTLRRADRAACTAMHTSRSTTSAEVFTPSASLMSLPNCENCQQQKSRPQTVRWIIGRAV
mmetsp:Transcript_83749/g.241856  ORF Transcript_83749/g.241856 Transcript_83749/m.241856 type:complete len:218 (-) Transcript_83749:868-1521(-)